MRKSHPYISPPPSPWRAPALGEWPEGSNRWSGSSAIRLVSFAWLLSTEAFSSTPVKGDETTPFGWRGLWIQIGHVGGTIRRCRVPSRGTPSSIPKFLLANTLRTNYSISLPTILSGSWASPISHYLVLISRVIEEQRVAKYSLSSTDTLLRNLSPHRNACIHTSCATHSL